MPVGADDQQSQLCPRPTAGFSKLLRCIGVPLLEQWSPESAKQFMMLIALDFAKLSVQASWNIEQGHTDGQVCMRNVQYIDMHHQRCSVLLTAIRHKLMTRWKLAISITAYKVCRQWLMMSLRDAVDQTTMEVNIKHSSRGGVSEAPVYLHMCRFDVAQCHSTKHELCQAEGRHGRGSCHTSPDQNPHLICTLQVESQVCLT